MSWPGSVSLVVQTCRSLGWTQRKLGENVGVSRRTVARWIAGESAPSTDVLATLAQQVHPVDPGLAGKLAISIGRTPASLGLVPPVAPPELIPPAPAPPPPAPTPMPMSVRDLIDCVVCSVAEAADSSPKAVRPMVLLALRRAHELGLDLAAAANASAPGGGAGQLAPPRSAP